MLSQAFSFILKKVQWPTLKKSESLFHKEGITLVTL